MSTHLGLDTSDETRLGASSTSLPQAASVLRARAAAAGLPLRPASEVDLAAAVVAADVWAALLNASSVSTPAQHGPDAVAVLAAILRRAAGQGGAAAPLDVDGGPSDQRLLTSAAAAARWAVRLVGSDAPEALRRAACDLASAGPRSRFSALAEVLVLTSDDVDRL